MVPSKQILGGLRGGKSGSQRVVCSVPLEFSINFDPAIRDSAPERQFCTDWAYVIYELPALAEAELSKG